MKTSLNALFNQQPVLSPSVLNQQGMVIWLLGLSGAGKSTIAGMLKAQLSDKGFFSIILDGDEMRAGLNKDLSFTVEDRLENVRRVAETANMLVGNNVITICSLITPLQEYRDLARERIQGRYFEVFVDCPLAVCEQRDVKGLYKKARENKIKNFTGIGAAFTPSQQSDLVLHTSKFSAEECVSGLYNQIESFIHCQD